MPICIGITFSTLNLKSALAPYHTSAKQAVSADYKKPATFLAQVT